MSDGVGGLLGLAVGLAVVNTVVNNSRRRRPLRRRRRVRRDIFGNPVY